MYILWSFFLGVGLAMDAFAVSISNAIRYKFDVKRMILIALTYALFQGLMPAIGFGFSELLKNISWFNYAIPIIGCSILLFLGVKTIIEAYKERKDIGFEEDEIKNISKPFSIKLLIIQAVATSIDALTVGIGLDNTISAIYLWQVIVGILVIVLVTFIICYCGLLLGKALGLKMKSNAGFFGGAILICIALKILIEMIIELATK